MLPILYGPVHDVQRHPNGERSNRLDDNKVRRGEREAAFARPSAILKQLRNFLPTCIWALSSSQSHAHKTWEHTQSVFDQGAVRSMTVFAMLAIKVHYSI